MRALCRKGFIKSTRHKVNTHPTLTSNIIHASNNTIHQSYTLQTLMYTLFIHTHAYIKNPSSSMNAYTCSKKKATQSSWTESTTLSHCPLPRQRRQMLSPSPTRLPLRSPYAGRDDAGELFNSSLSCFTPLRRMARQGRDVRCADLGYGSACIYSLHAYITRGLLLLGRKREGVSLTLSPSVNVDEEYSTRVEDGEEMLIHQSKSLPASFLLPLSLSQTLNNTQNTEKQKSLSRFLAQL